MPRTTIIGDIALKVGEYHDERANQSRNRSRTLGTLFLTEHSDGTRRYWAKLNQDALNPSLLILAREFAKKGEDTLGLTVFQREEDRRGSGPSHPPTARQSAPERAAAGPPPPGLHDDDIPF